MMRNFEPVSINGLEFDALISEELTLEATVPEYVTDDGFTVSDTIILNNQRLSLVLYLTDYPVTYYGRNGHEYGHMEETVEALKDLFFSKQLVTVSMRDKTYENMAIESITVSKTLEVGYAREIPISLRQVETTQVNVVTIPANYGKAGATGDSSGTANTSAGAGGNGNNNGEEGNRCSVLYGAFNSAGIINPSTTYESVGGGVYGGRGGSF